MPFSKNLDDFDKINFIVNSQIFGCHPPFTAVIQFAKQPALDVFLVMVTPDWVDLVKRWLRPGTPRHRKPARHGRKRFDIDMLTDPWEYTNERVYKTTGGVYPGIKLPGAKALFFIGDVVDRVNWTAFCLEGLTEIGFQGILGSITANLDGCENFAFVSRETEGWPLSGGAGDLGNPIFYNKLLQAQGFVTTGPGSFNYLEGQWTLAGSVIVMGQEPGGVKNYGIVIRDTATGAIVESSGRVNLQPGETASLTISADREAGQSCYVGHVYDSGWFLEGAGAALAWQNLDW